jgi:hypothetical protein
MALQLLWALDAFQFPDLFTIDRTPWTNDQLNARPLPKHWTAQTQNKHIYKPNIHALSGIRTHDPSVRESEERSCLRARGHCDRRLYFHMHNSNERNAAISEDKTSRNIPYYWSLLRIRTEQDV